MLSAAAIISLGCIVAVWGLYPLTVWLIASMRRRAVEQVPPASPPGASVSVVVATRAGAELVGPRVENLLASAYPAHLLEVVVAYDARTTEARIDPAAFAGGRVRVVEGDAPGGKAAALNAGVRAATGEIVAFADAGQRFEEHAIARLAEAVGRPGIGAASGRLELPGGAQAPSVILRLYWRLESLLRRSEAVLHSSVGVTGAIYAMRRSLWVEVPAGLILDDVYVPMRLVLAGHRVGYVDGARAHETRPATDTNEYRRKVRTLTGVWQLCAWLPSVLVPWRNPTWVQFVFHKLLRLLTPYWALICTAWVAVAVGRRVGPLTFVLLVSTLALVTQLRARPFVMLRRALATGVMLQLATVTATANGARKRWDVWQA